MEDWLVEIKFQLSHQASDKPALDTLPEGELFDKLMQSPADWVETFCVNPLAPDKAIKLTDFQREVLNTPYRLNAIRCARGRGKTFILIAYSLYYLFTKPFKRELYIGPQEPQRAEFESMFLDIIDASPLLELAHRDRQAHRYEVKCLTGGTSRLTLAITNVAQKKRAISIRGAHPTLLVIDEADYLTDDDYTAIIPLFNAPVGSNELPLVFVASTLNDKGKITVFKDWATSDPTADPMYKFKGWWLPASQDPSFTEQEREQTLANFHYDMMKYYREMECDWRGLDLSQWNLDNVNAMFEAGARFLPEKNDLITDYPKRSIHVGIDWNESRTGIRVVVLELSEFTRSGQAVIDGIGKPYVFRVAHTESIDGDLNYKRARTRILSIYQDLTKLRLPITIWVDAGGGPGIIQDLKDSEVGEVLTPIQMNAKIKRYLGRALNGGKMYDTLPWRDELYNALIYVVNERIIAASPIHEQLRAELNSLQFEGNKPVGGDDHYPIALALALYPAYSTYIDEIKTGRVRPTHGLIKLPEAPDLQYNEEEDKPPVPYEQRVMEELARMQPKPTLGRVSPGSSRRVRSLLRRSQL